jgi:hypothetical protein
MNGTSMDALVGGTGADSFTLATLVPTFNGSITGGGGTDTLAATDGTNAWVVNAADGGTLNSSTTFTAIANLTGGSGADSFAIQNNGTTTAGSVSGTIAGAGGSDSLSLAAVTTASTISLAGSGAGSVSGGTTVGNFTGIETLVGDGANHVLTGGSSWLVNGLNSGTVDGYAFSNFANLTGTTGNDTFAIATGGSISGTINGNGFTTADTLDYSSRTSTVSVVLTSTATGSGAGTNVAAFIGINKLVGSSATDNSLIGPNAATTWNVTGADSGNLNGQITFSAFANLTGGNNDDTFKLASGGSVSGTMTGGGFATTADTLDYSGRSSTVNVTVTDTATGAGFGDNVFAFTGITNLVGSTATNNVLVGPAAGATFNVTGANSGSLDAAVAFSAFQNLTGGAGADDFKFASGSLTGSIDGGTGTNTLSINSGSATIGGTVTNMNSLTVATTGTATFQGAVTAGAVTVTNSGGTTFQSTLNANTVALTNTTGTIAFQGNTTVNSGLTAAANGYSVSFTGASNSIAGTTTFNNSGTLTLGDGGDAIAFTGGVVATAPSSKTIDGTVSAAGTGVINLGTTSVSVTGDSTIGGSSTGQITLGATTLADGVTLTLGAGAVTPISTSSISGTASGAASNLAINTTGIVTVGGAVGTDIGTVTVTNSGGTSFQSTLNANTVALTNTTGTIAFQGNTTVNSGLTAAANGYSVSFTGASNSIAGTTTFSNTGTLTLGDGGDAIAFTGGVVATAPSSKTIAGTVTAAGTGVINLGTTPVSVTGDSTIGGASTGQITLGATTLADGVTLTLGAGAATPISTSSIGGTASGTASNLTINTTGGVTVGGAVGTDIGTVALNNGGGTVTFQGDFSAATVTTAANAFNLDFLGSVTQIGSATTFANSGRVQLGDQTADAVTISGALTHTAGATRLAGDIGVAGAVSLNATDIPSGQIATIDAATNPVIFNTTVDGPGALVVNTSGTTTFTGKVGFTTPLASIQTDDGAGADSTLINGNLVQTVGAQSFGDAVTASNLTLTSTGNGAITATNAGNDFTGTLTLTGGTTQIVDANNLLLGNVNVTGSASFTANNGSIVTADALTGGLSATGAVSLVAKDATGGDFGTITIGSGGLHSGGGGVALSAADDITLSSGAVGAAGVYSNGGPITVLAGQSAGMLANPGSEAADNFGAVTLNAALNAGSGNVTIVTAGDASAGASQSDVTQGTNGQIVANVLTVVTLKGAGGIGNGGANIDLNDATTPAKNQTGSINLFSCPSGGCPSPVPTPLVNAFGTQYASGAIDYSDAAGVNVSGIGTVSDFSTFSATSMQVTGGSGISASNLIFESGQDIDINLASNLTQINANGSGSLRFIAGRDIRYNYQANGTANGSIGSSSTNFNHDVVFQAGRNVTLENSIYQGARQLTIAADAAIATGNQTVSPDGVGNVLVRGNQLLRTLGGVSITGVDFMLAGDSTVFNFTGVGGAGTFVTAATQSAHGEELIAAGTIDFNNSGAIKVIAGASTGQSASGARVQGSTINVGSSSTPGSNPTLLQVQGGQNNVGYSTADTSDPEIELRQANAIVVSSGDMNIFLRSAPLTSVANGVPFDGNYSLVVRGGSTTAVNTGANPLFVEALGALQASKLVLDTQGTIHFQGGTASLQTANALSAASALLRIQNDKTVTTHNGGSVVLIGGRANVSANDAVTGAPLTSTSAQNAQAMAQADPSKLTMTVDGILVLQGGKTSGPQGSVASARIDAGDEIRITVAGTAPYTYTTSGGASQTLAPNSFFMIGGADSGFFDSNNINLATNVAYPQSFPITIGLAGGFLRVSDAGLAGGIVQTGLFTFDQSLLSYVIFANNVETRTFGIRKGLESDEIGAAACK